MYIKVSFESEFNELMMNLWSIYSKELFELEGIGTQLDINKFAKKFFNSNKSSANNSIDSNSNVSEKNSIVFDREFSKPYQKYNSLFLLWKELKKLYGLEVANRIIKNQLIGKYYINDSHNISIPYSYHPQTNIIVKINGMIKSISMEDLFKELDFFVENLSDRDNINLQNHDIYVYDNGNFVKLTRLLRHRSHNDLIRIETKRGGVSIITEDHPVILHDGSEKQANDITYNDEIMHCDRTKFNGNKKVDNAYFIGAMIGDGWVSNKKCGFSQKNIKDSHFYDIIKNNCDHIVEHKEDKIYFGDVKYSEKMKKMIGHLATGKHLPYDFFEWDYESKLNLMSGVIDTDGCINKRTGVVDIRLSSYNAIQQISELASHLGCIRIRTSLVNHKKREKSYNTKLHMYRVSFRITDNNFFNTSIKIKKHEDIILKKVGKDGRWDSNKPNKIDKIKWKGNYVYDITTETGTFYNNNMIVHNCFNYTCYDIALMGLPMINKITSKPPKYLLSYRSQIEQFIVIAGNSTLGATGIADFLIISSYYYNKILKSGHDCGYFIDGWFSDSEKEVIIKEIEKLGESTNEDLIEEITNQINNKLNKKEPHNKKFFKLNVDRYIKEQFYSFIYTINQPNRGNQSCFTNISLFDDNFLDKMCFDYKFVDGSTDKELTKKLQSIFIDCMNSTLSRTPATFPVTTACFSTNDYGEILDKEFLDFISEKDEKFGFINIYMGKTSTLSSCCRLRSNIQDLNFNTIGGSSTKIGSIGVVTLNLPRIAYDSYNEDDFLNNIEFFASEIARINNAKRSIIKKRIDLNAMPLYSLGFMDLTQQFSTCGFTGMWEAVNYLNKNISLDDYSDLAVKILNVINKVNDTFSKRYGTPHNTEQTPSENSAIKLVQKDRFMGYSVDCEFYSNQFIPLQTNSDMLDRIKIQGKLDKECSGGAIAHININEPINKERAKELTEMCAKMGIIYYAKNYILNRCKNNHMSVGTIDRCSCGADIVDKFTRVVGFLTNVSDWHDTRKENDFPVRQFY